MRDSDDPFDGTFVLLLIGGAIILALMFGGNGKSAPAPTYATDSYNTYNYTETHTTNIDICGICINNDR